jgi:hypothetical protein
VFGALLGLDGPPKFKSKKMPKDEFASLIGDLKVSVRYVGNFRCRYDADFCLDMIILISRLMLMFIGSRTRAHSNSVDLMGSNLN